MQNWLKHFFFVILSIISSSDSDEDIVTCFSAIKFKNSIDDVRLHSHEVRLRIYFTQGDFFRMEMWENTGV